MNANTFSARRTWGRNRGRRRGQVLIYMALGLVALLMVGAYTLDVGYLYIKRTQVQATADSAALAGAFQLAHFRTSDYATTMARYYAALPANGSYATGDNPTVNNGVTKKFEDSKTGTEISVTYPARDEKGVVRENWLRVDLSRPEDTFFAGIMGRGKVMVGTYAVAQYETLAPMSIAGNGSYGADPDEVNLSVFGPNALYAHGDCYSPMYLDDKVTRNPLYDGKGYDFTINVPTTITNATLELYDPDCYNVNNGLYTATNSTTGKPTAIDELRDPAGNGSSSTSYRTTTRYTLYDDNGTPNNPDDDKVIGTQDYGNTSSTDMKWNNTFQFNRASYGTRNFRLNVTTISGSGENGFSIRVGPTRSSGTAFNPNNGTSITANGHLPINFNQVATAKIALGTVPTEAAGGKLNIRKFDTDVGAQNVTYTCSTLPGQSWSGDLSANGKFANDVISVPTNYTAGIWYANYTAGANDTSVWNMSYTNAGPGQPGYIKLVR